jgi:hypothetical protein
MAFSMRDNQQRHYNKIDLSLHKNRIVQWCSDYLNGFRGWSDDYDFPGAATLCAIPLISVIQDAMTENSQSFSRPEDFKKNVIARLRDVDEWRLEGGTLIRRFSEQYEMDVAISITTDAKFKDVEIVKQAFEGNKIVYVPLSVGYFHLYSVDVLDDRKVCRQLVNGWLS